MNINGGESMAVYILGISAYYHDSAAALLKDGEVVAAAQEERFSRIKHDASFPSRAVAYCLETAGIGMRDVQHVAFYDKPFPKLERLLLTYLSFAPSGLHSFLQAMPLWLKDKLFLKDTLMQELSWEGDILFCEHHEAHAASAFFPSPFNKAAVLTMDGVGEWATTSFGKGEGNSLELTHELTFPHSLGLLYSAFTYYCGFRVNSGEYKLMGLAPYGHPRYVDLIRDKLVDVKPDGSFRLNMEYFDYCVGLTMTNDRFHRLFKRKPRKPDTEIAELDMDLAASIQAVTEDVMLRTARYVRELTGEEYLCLAGGVALNCVGNGKIAKEGIFKKIWIQPAAGDAGGAYGAGLTAWYRYLGRPRLADDVHDAQLGSLLGPGFTGEQVEAFLKSKGASYHPYKEEEIAAVVADLVIGQKVVGLVQGRMEYGPRALGCRSILADARSPKMQIELNLRTKFRESFRPFALSILEDEMPQYMDLPYESPYMLMVGRVRDAHLRPQASGEPSNGLDKLKVVRSSIPAVTHVDCSARVQTVSDERAPYFYKVLKSFYEKTGCPLMINTSFNIRGEPIVCSLEDAYRCFMCTDIDVLVFEHCVIYKEEQADQGMYQRGSIIQIPD